MAKQRIFVMFAGLATWIEKRLKNVKIGAEKLEPARLK